MAYQKLCRGQFSASCRVSTFLSTVNRYQVQVNHISGAANLPSDHASRNALQCKDGTCQVCTFVAETEEATVHAISVQDVTEGRFTMPFTSRAAWRETQLECPNLRRVHAHLKQGTRPTQKETDIKDVKRYLHNVTISRDGLLVVRDTQLFQAPKARIVVPRSVIDGLLSAIHIKFNHPSEYQMRRLVSRYFFALDMAKSVTLVVKACHHCASLKLIPRYLQVQSSTTPPDHIGSSFAMDIMKRCGQLILVLRECTTSYTLSCFVSSEKSSDICQSLLILCAGVRNLGDAGTTIRVDPAPGMTALVNNALLQKYNITVEVGHHKNVNKNPVAEKAIEELGLEMLNISPEGGAVSELQLTLATANLNMRIRRDGLSSREMWTQRDQISGQQLPLDDQQIIKSQHLSRIKNHIHSARSKAPNSTSAPRHPLHVGDLVYIAGDRDKCKARDKYIITKLNGDRCEVRKFTTSQFRARTYDVLITDCYPISQTIPQVNNHGPIRGFDSGISDSRDIIPTPSHTGSPFGAVTPTDSGPSPGVDNSMLQPTPCVHPRQPRSITDLPPDTAQVPPPGEDPAGLPHMGPPPILTAVPVPSPDDRDHAPEPDPPPDHSSHQDTPTNEPRRSTRLSKPPKWMSDDLWDLS